MEEAWLIPAIPAAAFVILLLFGKYIPRGGDFIAIGAIAASFVLLFPVLIDLLDRADGTEFFPAGNGCSSATSRSELGSSWTRSRS
jgi:NADH:ubiquinone oxidoreductase subunit 5 (subunit L)/multisubunit Na+/H+ antiporter MnhA subunit